MAVKLRDSQPGMIFRGHFSDHLETWFTEDAADGFNLMPQIIDSGLDDVPNHVVPILQERGLFRDGYRGVTLRSHYLEEFDRVLA